VRAHQFSRHVEGSIENTSYSVTKIRAPITLSSQK
jgi:hypothetical protein